MTPLTSSLLTFAQANKTAPPPVAPPQPTAQTSEASTRFSNALASALDAQAAANGGATGVIAPTQGVAAADAAARARQALQLESPTAPTAAAQGGGDAVLNGLQKLRGVFDQQISSFANSEASVNSTEGLYKAQVAAANFSMFMEVGSKLAGKASQAFQTLLKGQ